MKLLTLTDENYDVLRAVVSYCLALLEETEPEGGCIASTDPDMDKKYTLDDVKRLDLQVEYNAYDLADMLGAKAEVIHAGPNDPNE